MMGYAELKRCIGNISTKSLILQDIYFNKRKLNFAEELYNKALLNNDYSTMNDANGEKFYRRGRLQSSTDALRYLLAQEAEASGRQVSATMEEFDKEIQEMVNGKQ
jgi:hypothetical protein